MILRHVFGLFAHPADEWETIRDEQCSVVKCYFSHVLILAAIPAVCGFFGTTQVGWRIGSEVTVRLTTESALIIAILFYGAMLVGVFIMGKLMQWMAVTYGVESPSLGKCVTLASYIATPLFLSGVIALYPILWLDMLVGLAAVAYTIYLLYTGIPIVMGISKEQGFLFASAVLTVGLVMLVGMLAVTVLLWGTGFAPSYTI